MSNEDVDETANVNTTTTPKKKRQLSQEQLDKLAVARQKANLVRKQKSDEKSEIRRREQELKRLQAKKKWTIWTRK